MIRNAIISVFDKKGVVEFGDFLTKQGVTIFSTGGTYKQLATRIGERNLREVSSLTEFPEMLGGRVKTLHPRIHGGLLAKRDDPTHIEELRKHEIPMIDLVVANLYPFEEVLGLLGSESEPELLENIDIGGHTLIRASAKNYHHVLTVVDPTDYQLIQDNWNNLERVRGLLAKKAWDHVCRYDMAISGYFNPDKIYRGYTKVQDLKYGTNPQQKIAGIYENDLKSSHTYGVNRMFTIKQGNIGYINVLDAIYGFCLVCELSISLGSPWPITASYKHNSPAGVAIGLPLSPLLRKICLVGENHELSPVACSYVRARNVDPMCSFGDFIAVNTEVDEVTAKLIASDVSDGIIATGYTPEAFEILKNKKGGQFVILEGYPSKCHSSLEIREMHGVTLVQEENRARTDSFSFTNIVTTQKDVPKNSINDMIIANTTLKYTQSNSVCSALGGQVLGVGAGQQSRIDCVKLVKRKTQMWYLRQHPKCLRLIDLFKAGTKRVNKINAVVKYIEGDFTTQEYADWLNLFVSEPNPLTPQEKEEFLKTLQGVSLASDAFFPFKDNIEVASQFGVKYIIQPGGSIADPEIIETCDKYSMTMAMTGPNMRLFLH